MRIAVPREIVPGECRVALDPDAVARLIKLGHSVAVQQGAGERAGWRDDAYTAAGAQVTADLRALYADADAVLKVQPPVRSDALGANEASAMRTGALLIAFLRPFQNLDGVRLLAERGVTSFAMELVPRISRAQGMDALSSQATVAGYKAVILAADHLPKLFPMLMTAAGTIRPARVLVLGAGVAGLQAIATAKRLGAVVEAFDTRPAVAEQVQSLGAKFVGLELTQGDAQDAGGYARALGEEHLRAEQTLIADHAADADVVITTAQIPGKPAPRLITLDTLRRMRPGSVVMDLAAESGGNCEATVAGETITRDDVTVMGPLHLPSEVPFHASQMYARNLLALFQHLAPKGALQLDMTDEITRAACLTTSGEVVNDAVRARLAQPATKGVFV